MPICKNDPKSSYKGDEPSPKGLGYCAHSEKVGTIKKGRDNNKWIISETSKKIKRWVKLTVKKSEIKKVSKEDKKVSKEKSDCSKFVAYQKQKGKYSIETIFGIEYEKGKIYKYKGYNKFDSKPTIVRSDWKKRRVSKDSIERYCGSKKEIKKNSSDYEKIKKSHRDWKHYITNYNGNEQFCLYISPKNEVDVYKVDENNEANDDNYGKIFTYTKLVKTFKAKEVFIGKSPKSLSDYNGKEYDGNSILLYLGLNKYIFIGNFIFSFTTKNKIIKYFSPMGNSSVTYPFAIDDKNNYYLMTEDCVITMDDEKYENYFEMRKKNKLPLNKTDFIDIYDYYYNLSKTDKIKEAKLFTNKKIIEKSDW